jgi:outer membrane protein OmpA-like peptidoglycan-associated protein
MAALAWTAGAARASATPIGDGQNIVDPSPLTDASSAPALNDAPASSTDDFTVVRTVTVSFGKDKFDVPRSQKDELRQLITRAQDLQDYIISVAASAPPVGSELTTQKLSMLRASAITAILRQAGVPLANVIVSAARDIYHQVSPDTASKGSGDDRRVFVTLLQNKH